MDKIPNEIKTMDAYIATFPEDVQKKLEELRAVIKAAAPGALEGISYHMPAFALKGNLVYFAAFKQHLGLYHAGNIAEFAQESAPYEGEKGALRFPLNEPLPVDLISRIVKYRVAENLKKAEMKKSMHAA